MFPSQRNIIQTPNRSTAIIYYILKATLLLTIVYFRGNNVIQWRAVYLHTNVYFQLFCIGFINSSNFTSIKCKNVHANGEIQLLNLKLTESRLFKKCLLHCISIIYFIKWNLLHPFSICYFSIKGKMLPYHWRIWQNLNKSEKQIEKMLYIDPWILKNI